LRASVFADELVTRTSRSARGNPSGCSSTALKTVKTAVVAAMPRANVAITASEKPGDLRRERMA
jgi:hypothetical protein